MKHLSVVIPKSLYDRLNLKSKELGGISVSDTVRILLQTALKDTSLETQINNIANLQKKLVPPMLAIQSLLEMVVASLDEEIVSASIQEPKEKVFEVANQKTEKAVKSFFEELKKLS